MTWVYLISLLSIITSLGSIYPISHVIWSDSPQSSVPPSHSISMRIKMHKTAQKDNIKGNKMGRIADMRCKYKQKATSDVCPNDSATPAMPQGFGKGGPSGDHWSLLCPQCTLAWWGSGWRLSGEKFPLWVHFLPSVIKLSFYTRAHRENKADHSGNFSHMCHISTFIMSHIIKMCILPIQRTSYLGQSSKRLLWYWWW